MPPKDESRKDGHCMFILGPLQIGGYALSTRVDPRGYMMVGFCVAHYRLLEPQHRQRTWSLCLILS